MTKMLTTNALCGIWKAEWKLLPAFSSLLRSGGNVYKTAQENAACSPPFGGMVRYLDNG